MLQDTTILGEIYRLNRTYLTTLHRHLQEDFTAAVGAFGLPEELARALAKTTPAKLERLARTSQLLLRFRFNDVGFLRALAAKIDSGVAQHLEAEDAVSADQ